ncbi:MAG: DUF2948 family protein [Pseudomonadota bacterium]
MPDARFEDHDPSAGQLRLALTDPDDVPVISSLVQDAVGLVGEISWMPKRRRLTLLLNRFRWEDKDKAAASGRPFQRVRSALVLDSALNVRTNGLSPQERDMVYSVLQVRFEAGEDAAGQVFLDLSGDGTLEIGVECLDGRLMDLSAPWDAKAGAAPDHPLD